MKMWGAFLFSYAGNHPGAALLGRPCPHQQAAQTERQPGTLRDAVWGCVQKIRQELAPPRALTHHSAVFLPPNALPQPLQTMPGPHAAPLSRLRGLSVPASPHHRCPHGFSCTPQGSGKAWHSADVPAAGVVPATGLGLLQHLPLLHEAKSTTSPPAAGGKGAGTPQTPLTNIPQQVHSCRQAEERGRGADRVIPCSRDGVWGKNHPLPPSGSG